MTTPTDHADAISELLADATLSRLATPATHEAQPPCVLEFIDRTLADMTTRPALWGPLPGVELQVLRLLEIRLLLTVPHADSSDTSEVARCYWEALARDFPGSDAVSLRTRVDNDVTAFARWLSQFCAEQKHKQDQRAKPRIASLP